PTATGTEGACRLASGCERMTRSSGLFCNPDGTDRPFTFRTSLVSGSYEAGHPKRPGRRTARELLLGYYCPTDGEKCRHDDARKARHTRRSRDRDCAQRLPVPTRSRPRTTPSGRADRAAATAELTSAAAPGRGCL